MDSEKNKNIYILVAGAFILLAVIVLGGLYLFFPKETPPFLAEIATFKPRIEEPLTEHYPYGESGAFLLREGDEPENRLYRNARSTWKDLKDYDGALKKYEEAFRVVKNQDGRAQIRYEIALIENEAGDPIEAIQILKEVAVMPDISNLIRASAIDQMVQIFYSRGDERIFQEIFSGDLFKDFLSSTGSKRTSLVNLLEFGSSFYPLAWSQLEIADWYATGLLLRKTDPQNEFAPQPPYRYSEDELKSIIKEKIKNADQDIERLQEVYTSDSRLVGFTYRKAIIASKLERIGDPFLGNAEALFKKALEESRIMGVPITEAFILYGFAVHLAQTEPERSSDIKSLLANFYNSNKFTSSPFFEFLKNEKANVLNNRDVIELLAQIDPQFKSFLSQLGWDL